MRHIIEKEAKYKGMKYVCIGLDVGHRCGYVGVTKDSPFFGIKYSENITDKFPVLKTIHQNAELGKKSPFAIIAFKSEEVILEILIDVHGGLTFSGGGDYPIKDNLWWFGFDCAHAGDGKDGSLIKDEKLKNIYLSIDGGPIRTLDYVESECQRMIHQILELERIIKDNK